MLRAAEACTRVALLCRACRVCRVCRSCCTARRGVDAGGARVSWSVVRYASHSLWSVPSSPSRRVSGMWCCGGWWSGCALSGVCGGHATRHVSAKIAIYASYRLVRTSLAETRARRAARSANGNAPRFGFHTASAQWPVPSRVLVDVVPCVPGPSASLRRDALCRPSRLRWPIPVHPVAPPRPARSSTKQFGEVTSSKPSKHIIRAH